MMFLAGLAVVFAGLLGGKGNVNAQLTRVLRELHVEVKPLPAAKLRTLTRHTAATRTVVRALHADGVIACEIVHRKTLRLVIYEGDGSLKTFTELPLSRRGLGADELAVLRENLRSEVIALRDSDEMEAATPPPSRAAQSRGAATRPASARPAPSSAGIDDEDPLGGSTTSTSQPATDVAIADDASGGGEIDGPAAAEPAAQARSEATASKPGVSRVGLSAGAGVAARSFDPATAMVAPYTSSPVPVIVVDARIQPARRLAIHLGGERTLRLSTEMGDGSFAPTAIARWYASAEYALVHGGAIVVAARLGGARRSFTIDTSDPDRSPDRAYTYAIAGLTASAHIGRRLALFASAAFEPVLFADQAPMAPGESGRWALDVGGGVEVRATSHVFVRAAASYERFSWSYLMDGEGIASDAYPTGTLSLGADY